MVCLYAGKKQKQGRKKENEEKIGKNTARQSYRRDIGEWDVAHYLLIRYYPATDGRIREQLCVLTSWQASLAQRKPWLLRVGTLELFINTLYLITEKETHTYTQNSHAYIASGATWPCLYGMMMMSCEHTASRSRMDGNSWRVGTARRKRRRCCCQACPAELWDSEFDRATFHSLLGFRGMQSYAAEGNLWHMCLQGSHWH